MKRAPVWIPLGCWLLAGCGEAGPSDLRSEFTENGVRTVTYSEIPPTAVTVLDSLPYVRIGQVDGTPDQLFSSMPSAVDLGPEGILVADGGSLQLRWYTPSGTHVRSVGGPGDGPGEFRTILRVARMRGDSLVAVDSWTGRITYFGPDGQVGETHRLPHVPQSGPTPAGGFLLEGPEIAGVFANGDLLARGVIAWRDVPTGVRNDSLPLLRYDRSNRVALQHLPDNSLVSESDTLVPVQAAS